MKNNYQEAQDEFDELTKHLSPEERMQMKTEMIRLQKEMVMKEPWLIADWPRKDREKFLQRYTDVEKQIMFARIDLEYQHIQDKKKGFG